MLLMQMNNWLLLLLLPLLLHGNLPFSNELLALAPCRKAQTGPECVFLQCAQSSIQLITFFILVAMADLRDLLRALLSSDSSALFTG